ncbi:MAG: adenylate/guanylate cyclase domain-containing protein [Candidatus Muirbacterium halophilum]|nr:adenylate/guanylate cyclase domain-containing protein [Candidatus Muirbacterium halophilum]
MILRFNEHILEGKKKKYGMDIEERTILFTDIKSSSELWNKYEEEMFKALDTHEKQIVKLSEKYNAVILKSIGDAFMLSFDKLKTAIDFAIELQKDLEKTHIKVGSKRLELRIGICGGEVYKRVVIRQGNEIVDYFGNVVNTASRMESKVSDVGGIAFAYDGKVDDLELDYKVDAIDFKDDCRVSERKRSERLLTDVHNYMCKNVSELKGVDEITAYKIRL